MTKLPVNDPAEAAEGKADLESGEMARGRSDGSRLPPTADPGIDDGADMAILPRTARNGMAAYPGADRLQEEADNLADRAVGGTGSEGLEERALATVPHEQTAHGRLPDSVRRPLERAFTFDFGTVRIHTDAQSNRLNRDVQARAVTYGRNIFFRRGFYAPDEAPGRWLLAHELAHVVQQATGRVAGPCFQHNGLKKKTKQTPKKKQNKSAEQKEREQQQKELDKERKELAFYRDGGVKNMSDVNLKKALAFEEHGLTKASLVEIDERFFSKTEEKFAMPFEELLSARFIHDFTLNDIEKLVTANVRADLINQIIGQFKRDVGKKVLTSGLLDNLDYIANLSYAVDSLESVEWQAVTGAFNNGGTSVDLNAAYVPQHINGYKLTLHTIAHLINPRDAAHRIKTSELLRETIGIDKSTSPKEDEAVFVNMRTRQKIVVNENAKVIITIFNPA